MNNEDWPFIINKVLTEVKHNYKCDKILLRNSSNNQGHDAKDTVKGKKFPLKGALVGALVGRWQILLMKSYQIPFVVYLKKEI